MPISGFSLVRSKSMMPSPAGLLHRPRVCQAIERGLDGKLTIVSAPAGYGKTSALVDFAQNSPVPVCWYTADERDRDLGTFIEYLIGGIREQFPGFGGHTQETLNSQYSTLLRDSTGVVGDLTNEMLEIDTPFVVVVDNYEAVEGASGIRFARGTPSWTGNRRADWYSTQPLTNIGGSCRSERIRAEPKWGISVQTNRGTGFLTCRFQECWQVRKPVPR